MYSCFTTLSVMSFIKHFQILSLSLSTLLDRCERIKTVPMHDNHKVVIKTSYNAKEIFIYAFFRLIFPGFDDDVLGLPVY